MNHKQHEDFTEIAALWTGYTSEQAVNLIKGATSLSVKPTPPLSPWAVAHADESK